MDGAFGKLKENGRRLLASPVFRFLDSLIDQLTFAVIRFDSGLSVPFEVTARTPK